MATRNELSDVLNELTGELRCSHVSFSGGDAGDRRHTRAHQPGMLGCDFEWDARAGGYRVTHVVRGDTWDEARGGALAKPGVNIKVGMRIRL